MTATRTTQVTSRIEEWLCDYLSNLLEMPRQDIDYDVSFARFGLDSVGSVAITGDLAEWTGCAIDASVVFEHATIASLSRYLADRPDVQRALLNAPVPNVTSA